MSKEIYVWACDYSSKTGEGNLAKLFVNLQLNKYKKKNIKGPKDFTKKYYYKVITYKYMAPIIGIFFCWKYYLKNKEICYINYLPLWNFIVFLLLPPRTIIGPITGGSFYIVDDFQSLVRRYIFPIFYKFSIFLILKRNYTIIFATDLLKKKLPKKLIDKSSFNFVFYLFKPKKISKKIKNSFVIYYKKHKNKNKFFPYNFIKKLLKFNYKIYIIGDFLNIKNVKNFGFIKKDRLYKLLKKTKYSILSGENIFSLFTMDCINNNIKILVNKEYNYKIIHFKKHFKSINMENKNNTLTKF
tara:strand:+ start:285 stop:1181 length:897 start_codon:yes stop_codon:yes gene_type:complete